MKNRLSKLLPPAVASIKRVLAEPAGENPIKREYQGYISSFGASVKQMGLLPTLAAFASEKVTGGSKENKGDLLTILHEVIVDDASGMPDTLKSKLKTKRHRVTNTDTNVEHEQLFQYALDIAKDDTQFRAFRSHLLDAAVAVKLAIRTFKLSD